MQNKIIIKNAHQHNLRNLNLEIPRDTLTVFTGVSGSGKSSLAFDTIYQEGQRRYMESLSAYARQYLGTMEKPEVESIQGLSPTVCIDQKTVNRNPRSTVGTVTEIYDHLRLLYARLGQVQCPSCQKEIHTQTPDRIVDRLLLQHKNKLGIFMAPLIQERKGEYRKELEKLKAEGFIRVRIDGKLHNFEEEIRLKRYEKHTIEAILDRVAIVPGNRSRLVEAIEKAVAMTKGTFSFLIAEQYFLESTENACAECGLSFPEIEPRLFSFNNPVGACEACDGLGLSNQFLEELIIKDKTLSIQDGAITCLNEKGCIPYSQYGMQELKILSKHFKFSLTKPWNSLTKKQQEIIFYGSGKEKLKFQLTRIKDGKEYILKENRVIRGVIQVLERVYHFTKSKTLHKYMLIQACPACDGKRLKQTSLNIKFNGLDIGEMTHLSISELCHYFETLKLPLEHEEIGKDLLKELRLRLSFLSNVGLNYITLARSIRTLSGGEAQRIRLARQVGSGLTGVLYVLDEPSIGLHPRDNKRLLETLKHLKDIGNTVFVIEHDEETIFAADHIIDIGPGAGRVGGKVMVNGSLKSLLNSKTSLTGQYLSRKKTIPIPKKRRTSEHEITLKGASLHNLEKVDCTIPLGIFVCITGVSGSGKSTLIHLLLRQAIEAHFGNTTNEKIGTYQSIKGLEHIDKLIEIDQAPIGRTPRSNPATYTKVFDEIRKLFSQLPESKARGYKEGRFSFNVKGGRCETCQGGGYVNIDMHFLPNVEIPCSECEIKRFNQETLQILFKGKNIFDVLEMTVQEAIEFFQNIPKIKNTLQTLSDVGLSYIQLGQKSTTLSGGEAQRIKLAFELRKKSTGKTLYLLDEPTTGLHYDDIQKLLDCLNKLVEQGNTVLVIEHNLEVIKIADYLMDMGPEGGNEGGKIIFTGTPEEMVKTQKSYTAAALIPYLKKNTGSFKAPKETKTKKSVSETKNFLVLQGARKNNLKHINLKIPKNKITVFSGVSGSGKTSLAFDTIFAEGQSRFVESLSTYARRFLGRLDKGEIDQIKGLQPAIAIDQRSCSRNPRSTVATLTELYDYFRILYAQVGTPFCPKCNKELQAHSPQYIYRSLREKYPDEKAFILYPLYLKGKKLYLTSVKQLFDSLEKFKSEGYSRVLINKTKDYLFDELPEKLTKVQQIDLILDRVILKETSRSRIIDSLEMGYRLGKNKLKVLVKTKELFYHLLPNCTHCGFQIPEEITPKLFSFNSWQGGCPACQGLGIEIQEQEEEDAKKKIPKQKIICSVCNGERLDIIPRNIRLEKNNISQLCEQTPKELLTFFTKLAIPKELRPITDPLLSEIQTRLEFLLHVGLDYLNLSRTGETLSGGEAQRIRLATQMGNKLTGVLYVLDEPTIGLHPRDVSRLQETIAEIRDLGNTVILVEHDEEMLRGADYIVDLGPFAGANGGRVVAMNTPEKIQKNQDSLTGQYLSGEKQISLETKKRKAGPMFKIQSAETNNLKKISISIPSKLFVAITGVSGSGKSSLIMQTLVPLLQRELHRSSSIQNKAKLKLPDSIKNFQVIDQSPIGRTPKSTPATFTKVMDEIRDFFAKLPEAKQRGYGKARFSFNHKSGRCSPCDGMGQKKIEMHFLSDVYLTCEFCKGQRYNQNTLRVRYKGLSVADVLNQTVEQLQEVFVNHPKIIKHLSILQNVGLGYIKLGQASTTLSGGEAQRLKLAKELWSRSKETVYILDEPTVGLHPNDIQKLMNILDTLVEQGHTVIVIEHNLDVIRLVDHVIDLGPEGGDGGGKILFQGSPSELIKCKESHTGKFLKKLIKRGKRINAHQ